MRGRVDSVEGSFLPARDQESYEAAASKLRFFTVDLRWRKLVHFCNGAPECCATEDEGFNNCYTAGIEGGLFMDLIPQLPSSARLGTFTASVAGISAGVMIHEIAPACIEMAFQLKDDPNAIGIDNDDNDFRKYVAAKMQRTRQIVDNSAKLQTFTLLPPICEHVDWLW